MPPDPVLGLLSFLGLTLYAIIGAAVGTLTIKAIKPSSYDIKPVFGLSAGLWPIWIPTVMAGGVIGAIVIGPLWCCVRVGKYLGGLK